MDYGCRISDVIVAEDRDVSQRGLNKASDRPDQRCLTGAVQLIIIPLCSAGVAAAFATPGLSPFFQRNGHDHQRGGGIRPPPSGERIGEKADEQRD